METEAFDLAELSDVVAFGGGLVGVRDTTALDVCNVGGTSVAVGVGFVPGGSRGLVWTSQEGQAWEVAAPESMTGPRAWQVVACETTPEGIVAVGQKGAASSEESRAGVWTSVDGKTWAPVDRF